MHVSGSTATINGAVQHPGDAFAQTLTALGVIENALHQAGHALDDVVRTRIYVASAKDMAEVGRAHGHVFGTIRPAATMIAGIQFIDDAILVEIEAESYKKSSGEEKKIGGDGGI